MASSSGTVNPRVPKEFSKIKKEENSQGDAKQISVRLKTENDYSHWKAWIKGPEDTPYAGGIFTIDIVIPAQYPFTPPKMKFDTKVWHPNISSQTGAICLDILKGEWSPALTIRTALLSLQALLSTPEPDDPQDAVVASEYRQNIKKFKENATSWTQNYANDIPQSQKSGLIQGVRNLTNCDPNKAELYLTRYGWDQNTAVDKILSGEN